MADSAPRLGRLTASLDSDAAAWVPAALHGFAEGVGSIVPPVFDAYARVFHPPKRIEGTEEVPVRWADVAEANGRTMHPAAEWGSIVTGFWTDRYNPAQPGLWDRPPSRGELPHELARRLVAILSEHTGQPDHGFFAVWEGFGDPVRVFMFPEDMPEDQRRREEKAAQEAFEADVRAWRGLVDSGATFKVPGRGMHLLSAALEAIEDFYEGDDGLSLRHPPTMWWPADQAWCVSSEIDLRRPMWAEAARRSRQSWPTTSSRPSLCGTRRASPGTPTRSTRYPWHPSKVHSIRASLAHRSTIDSAALRSLRRSPTALRATERRDSLSHRYARLVWPLGRYSRLRFRVEATQPRAVPLLRSLDPPGAPTTGFCFVAAR
jgi:hypothetical protein